MILFKRITYKNFLSTGNVPVSITLDDTKATVIGGKNGCGKTTFSDAIFFALYGKAFRKVNRDSLINSINKKNLLVELELSISGNNYLIRRGIKPNIFEIFVNGTLRNQNASAKDYQSWLSKTLGMDERTFRQIITMGSSSYTPFMRLSALERRVIVEDILAIDIISMMHNIAKSRVQEYLNTEQTTQTELRIKEAELKATSNSLESVKTSIEDAIFRTNEKIDSIKREAESVVSDIQELKRISDKSKYNSLSSSINEINTLISDGKNLIYKYQHNLERIQKTLNFFETSQTCPYCTQPIETGFGNEKIAELETSKETTESKISKIRFNMGELESRRSEYTKEKDRLFEIESKLSEKYGEIEKLKSKMEFFANEKASLTQKRSMDEEEIHTRIKVLKEDIETLKKSYQETKEYLKIYEVIIGLLKDDGIRTLILKQYIGIINSLIKRYLGIINFNIGFSFDTNFNETIKSRGRDIFEYNNFSEGERLRIDFCLLFVFRELAKLRSTINTNLLIIDEQDGRLDADGVNAINQLLGSMNGNFFVISQFPEIYEDLCTRTIIMEKEQHFTKATVI